MRDDDDAPSRLTLPARPTPQWSDARARGAYAGFLRAKRRQRARRLGAALAALLAALSIGLYARQAQRASPYDASLDSPQRLAQPSTADPSTPLEPAPSPLPALLTLKDGSRALALQAQTQLGVVREDDAQLGLRLAQGAARFQVQPQPRGRTFAVQVEHVHITVLGTTFDVIREPSHVTVSVLHGMVRVRAEGQQEVLLGAAQSERFALARPSGQDLATDASPDASPALDQAPAPDPAFKRGAAAPPHELRLRSPAGQQVRQDWLKLATSGSFEQAAQHIEQNPWAVKHEPGELMLAADTLRYAKRYTQAIAHLERLERAFPQNPRAAQAALTRGLILLNHLHHHERAADAFAKARQRAPRSALAQDALAREVEALARAGQKSLAQARAQEYLRLYPEGHRADAVRHFGQLR